MTTKGLTEPLPQLLPSSQIMGGGWFNLHLTPHGHQSLDLDCADSRSFFPLFSLFRYFLEFCASIRLLAISAIMRKTVRVPISVCWLVQQSDPAWLTGLDRLSHTHLGCLAQTISEEGLAWLDFHL